MKLRAPSVPLITVDPYFSVWSAANNLIDTDTEHWTNKRNMIRGILHLDGVDYRFMGKGDEPALTQTDIDITAMYTAYTFEGEGIKLTATFFTPLMLDDLATMTRPVSYLKLKVESTDGVKHYTSVKLTASEELCLNEKGQSPIVVETLTENGIDMVKIGNSEQNVLWKSGDNIRIDWGYFYMAAKGAKFCEGTHTDVDPKTKEESTMRTVTMEHAFEGETLVEFAYDDIYSIQYFGENLKSVWNNDGKNIVTAITEAFGEYDEILCKAK